MADWKKVINSVAPTLASVLGGPGAGIAVKYIANELLGDSNATINEIEQAVLNANPEDLAKLKNIETNFKARMKELDVNILELTTKDRASAREMATKTSLAPQLWLTLLFIGGYFALLVVIFSGLVELKDSVRDAANLLLGALSSGVPMILKFWYGESRNSAQMLENIYRSTPKD